MFKSRSAFVMFSPPPSPSRFYKTINYKFPSNMGFIKKLEHASGEVWQTRLNSHMKVLKEIIQNNDDKYIFFVTATVMPAEREICSRTIRKIKNGESLKPSAGEWVIPGHIALYTAEYEFAFLTGSEIKSKNVFYFTSQDDENLIYSVINPDGIEVTGGIKSGDLGDNFLCFRQAIKKNDIKCITSEAEKEILKITAARTHTYDCFFISHRNQAATKNTQKESIENDISFSLKENQITSTYAIGLNRALFKSILKNRVALPYKINAGKDADNCATAVWRAVFPNSNLCSINPLDVAVDIAYAAGESLDFDGPEEYDNFRDELSSILVRAKMTRRIQEVSRDEDTAKKRLKASASLESHKVSLDDGDERNYSPFDKKP